VIEDDKITIENYANRAFEENYNEFKLYSNEYGKLYRGKNKTDKL